MSRQKLIHLHGKSRLTNAEKLNLGEIAVRNGSSATETELAVLSDNNGVKEVVYIPSLATVTGLTNAVDVKVTAVDKKVDEAADDIKELQDAVGLGENASGETLTDRVGGLEDILNGKEGEEGLVDKVSANTDAITANTETIEEIYAKITGDTGIDNTIAAANGRIDEIEDILNGKEGEKGGLVDKVSANTAAITVNTAAITANTAAISANTAAIATKLDVTAHTTSYDAIDARVTTVEDAITNGTTGLTKQVTDLNSWVANSGATQAYAEDKATAAYTSATTYTETVKSDLQGKIDGHTTRLNGLEASAATFVTKAEVQALDFNSGSTVNIVRGEGEDATTAATISVNAVQEDGLIKSVTVAAEGLATMTDVNAVDDKNTALETKVNTLIGVDAGKSVRTIANEELAAQLILSDAAESLDSLQEIAQWIQDHPEDAAAMNADIARIEGVLEGYMTKDADGNVTGSTGTVKADLSALTQTVTAVSNVANAAVKEVKTSGMTGVVVNTAENVATIDFSLMTIDCGRYDVADAE